jgi:hypothetical protein
MAQEWRKRAGSGAAWVVGGLASLTLAETWGVGQADGAKQLGSFPVPTSPTRLDQERSAVTLHLPSWPA